MGLHRGSCAHSALFDGLKYSDFHNPVLILVLLYENEFNRQKSLNNLSLEKGKYDIWPFSSNKKLPTWLIVECLRRILFKNSCATRNRRLDFHGIYQHSTYFTIFEKKFFVKPSRRNWIRTWKKVTFPWRSAFSSSF